MNDSPTPDFDALENLLALPVTAPNEASRQALLAQTTRVLRHRRHVKRLGQAAALAACYLAGIFTVRAWPPPVPENPTQVTSVQTEHSKVQPSAAVERISAADDAWLVVVDEAKRTEVYREAGDRYLQEQRDVTAAVHCYQHALESASDKDLEITPDDNFLLMALKKARQKEKRHVPNDG